MPAHTKVAEVKLPEAERLADLYGIEHDLAIAAYLCGKVTELSQPNYDYPLMEGIVSAAIIRYCRCFGHAAGVRLGLLDSDIKKDLSSEEFAAHQYFKALRDGFVAHSINPFEESYVTAAVAVRDGVKLPVLSISGGHTRFVPSIREAQRLSELIRPVREILKNLIEKEKSELLAFIQTLPLEVVHGWDLHSPGAFKDSDVSKKRTQHKRPKPNS